MTWHKTKIAVVSLAILFAVAGVYFSKVRQQAHSIDPNPTCSNYDEIEYFNSPREVVWKAKIDGCLVSCWGASFTRTDAQEKHSYPRFAGYVEDNGPAIPEHFVNSHEELLVTGKWTNISDDHVSVFNGKCVPTVEIENIEYVGTKTEEDRHP